MLGPSRPTRRARSGKKNVHKSCLVKKRTHGKSNHWSLPWSSSCLSGDRRHQPNLPFSIASIRGLRFVFASFSFTIIYPTRLSTQGVASFHGQALATHVQVRGTRTPKALTTSYTSGARPQPASESNPGWPAGQEPAIRCACCNGAAM